LLIRKEAVSMTEKIFCVTYIENGEERSIEVPAYSEEQAMFLLEMFGIKIIKIIDIECSIRIKGAGDF